ncbi:hypothetical protein G5645_13730 [Pectobacterium carotovorum]|nr:hypothetical protein [Pectobacterium carotovorum]
MPDLRSVTRLNHLLAYQPSGFVVLVVGVVVLGQPARHSVSRAVSYGRPLRV